MLNTRITLVVLVSLVPMFLMAGCSGDQKSVETTAGSDPLEIPQDDPVAKRFQGSAPQTPTAVQSAIELSEKHATLSDEAASLRRQRNCLKSTVLVLAMSSSERSSCWRVIRWPQARS